MRESSAALLTCAVTATLLSASVAQADLVLIDDFTTGGPYQDSLFTLGSRVVQQAGSMLGGERDLGYEMTENPFEQSLDIYMAGDLGLAAYAADPGVGGNLALDYDGVGEAETGELPFVRGPGLGSLDWSALDRLSIDFVLVDLPITVQVILESFDDLGEVSGTSMIEGAVDGGAPSSLDLLFADFQGSASFADVDRITFVFNSENLTSRDFVIQQITASPAPGALALLAGAGLLSRRRRRHG